MNILNVVLFIVTDVSKFELEAIEKSKY